MHTFCEPLNTYFLSAHGVPQGTSEHTWVCQCRGPASAEEELTTYAEYKGQLVWGGVFKYITAL